MTDTEWYEDDEQDITTGDRNLVKDLRNQLKAKAQAEKTAQEELDKLRSQVRRQSMTDVLKTSGVNEKVANLIPATVEPTAEAVGEWLKEYGELFGAPKGTDEAPAQTEPDPQMVGQMQAMQQVANTGQAPGGPSEVTQTDIQGANSMEELMALINKAKGA